MSVDFKIQTKDIDDSTFGYYQSSFDVTDDWQQITINIADLAQPAWLRKMPRLILISPNAQNWRGSQERIQHDRNRGDSILMMSGLDYEWFLLLYG